MAQQEIPGSQQPPRPARPVAGGPVVWVMAGVGLAVALALRLTAYVYHWPMHVDELRVTQNLAERGGWGLTQPLSHDQFTPVGVLWVIKALAEVFGYAEPALRLWPMLAGIAAVAVGGWWVWRAIGPWAGVFAIVLLAGSPKLVDHSVSVKQYASDGLVTAAILLAGWLLYEQRGRYPRAVYAVVCLAGVLFSHSSVFAIAGVTVALGIAALRNGGAKRIGALALMVVPSGVLFVTLYLINYSAGAHDDSLARYWQADFMPAPNAPGFIAWWPKRVAWLVSPVAYPWTLPAAGLMLVGVAWLVATRRWVLGLMITLPIVFTLLGSAAQAYPFAGRMVVFLSPLVAALIAAGLAWPLSRVAWKKQQALGLVAASTVFVALVCYAPLKTPRNPGGRSDLTSHAQALADLPTLARADTPVLVDRRLHYHYRQARRTGHIAGEWIERDLFTAQEIESGVPELDLAERLPPGPMPQVFFVVIPETVHVGRDRYMPTRDRLIACFAPGYSCDEIVSQDGAHTLKFSKR